MTVTASDITNLYNATGFNRACLADDGDGTAVAAERTDARANHWPILAYQIDLTERFPGSMTPAQAQEVADEINAGLETAARAALADG